MDDEDRTRVDPTSTTPSATPLRSGALVGGRYRLRHRIATGGVGQVWRAHDTVLDRPVAVKLLRNDVTDDPLVRQRFRAEARAAAALSHPCVAVVHDFGEHVGEDGTWPYLVMEHVEGESLSVRLGRDQRLDEATTLALVEQVASALSAAHVLPLVHRDVKPGNILLGANGSIKVTDFGIALSPGAEPLTATGTMLGTAAYVSPEQVAGAAATPASDVYALGLVAYEALSGARAFTGDSAAALMAAHAGAPLPPLPPSVRAEVADLVTAMTAKDPAARPSARAVATRAAALHAGSAPEPGGEPSSTRALPAQERPAVPLGRRGVVIAALVVLLAAAALLATSSWRQDDPPAATGAAAGGPMANPSSPAGDVARVRVQSGDHVGRSYRAVARDLRAAGLKPARNPMPMVGTVGDVVGLTPTGILAPGTRVTVSTVAELSPTPNTSGQVTGPSTAEPRPGHHQAGKAKPGPKKHEGKPGKGRGRDRP